MIHGSILRAAGAWVSTGAGAAGSTGTGVASTGGGATGACATGAGAGSGIAAGAGAATGAGARLTVRVGAALRVTVRAVVVRVVVVLATGAGAGAGVTTGAGAGVAATGGGAAITGGGAAITGGAGDVRSCANTGAVGRTRAANSAAVAGRSWIRCCFISRRQRLRGAKAPARRFICVKLLGLSGEARRRPSTANQTKPRFQVLGLKFTILGRTVDILPALTPNQLARVAPYWSTERPGSSRPCPTSSGPLFASTGGVP